MLVLKLFYYKNNYAFLLALLSRVYRKKKVPNIQMVSKISIEELTAFYRKPLLLLPDHSRERLINFPQNRGTQWYWTTKGYLVI